MNRPSQTLACGDPIPVTKTGVLALAAGVSRDETISVTLPGANGTYHAVALVDSACTVAEMDNTDNDRPDEYVVSTPQPNLTIVPGTFHVQNGAPGASVDATVTVRNDGAIATPAGYEVAVTTIASTMNCATAESGQDLGGILAAGASRSHTFQVTLSTTPGAHTATVMVDSDGSDPVCTITESNELDNLANVGYSALTSFTPATSNLDAAPTLVRKGNTTVLTVNATNVTSCTLSGDNGDLWTIFPNASGNIVNATRTTLPITRQTKFVLECTDLSNAPMLPREKIIKIVPTFREF